MSVVVDLSRHTRGPRKRYPFIPHEGEARKELLKLWASGCQALAIAIVITTIVGPLVNPALKVPPVLSIGGAAISGFLELAAVTLLGYLPKSSAPKEDATNG